MCRFANSRNIRRHRGDMIMTYQILHGFIDTNLHLTMAEWKTFVKCHTVSVQLTRAVQNFLYNIAIAIISTVPLSKWTNFIDMFKSFKWVYKLLVWTKRFQMDLVEWKTNVKCVQTVYR